MINQIINFIIIITILFITPTIIDAIDEMKKDKDSKKRVRRSNGRFARKIPIKSGEIFIKNMYL